MSPIQTVALAVRLFAIWLAIYGARWAPYFYGQARDSDDAGVTAIIVGAAIVVLLAVLFLWFFPRTVARSILPAGDPLPATRAIPDAWLAVGCVMLGLWVLSQSVPGLLRSIAMEIYARRANLPSSEAWGANVLYYIVELAIAVWLILGASGLRRVIDWARSRGET